MGKNSATCRVCGLPRSPGKACRACANKSNRKYRAKNPEKVRAQRAAYKKAKRAAEAPARAARKLAKKNSLAQRRRDAKKKWKLANPHVVNADTARRWASKFRATPAWANKFFIEEIYDLALLRTKLLGFPWHVDHIVPLRSDLVQGLHCEANLQVIPAVKNISKGNRYWPDMPGKGEH